MSKIKLLFVFLMTFGTTALFAQGTERKVSKIQEGTVLTADDVNFLHLVGNPKVKVFETQNNTEAKVAGKKYVAGQTLSKEDAESLNTAISGYVQKNPGFTSSTDQPTKPKVSGRALKNRAICWEKYWWCDAWGNCRWIAYWYYC